MYMYYYNYAMCIFYFQEYFESVDQDTLNDRLNNRRGVFGYTPLHEAISGKKHEVIKHLIERGANGNAKANSGYTPLHLAASAGHIDCVRELLSCGVDLNISDDYERTAMQTAGLSANSTIVRMLRSEGKYIPLHRLLIIKDIYIYIYI